jgi:dihydrofolate reductase
MPNIQLIAAMSKNSCIGLNNSIPWRIPEDMKHFKLTTNGHTVVMGRKTFESIGSKPLPGRKNIVLTQDKSFRAKGVEICHDYTEILRLPDEKIFIIGGEQIYKLFIDYADGMILTIIDEVMDGDAYFPHFYSDIDYRVFMEKDLNSSTGFGGKFLYLQRIKEEDYAIELLFPELNFYYIKRYGIWKNFNLKNKS